MRRCCLVVTLVSVFLPASRCRSAEPIVWRHDVDAAWQEATQLQRPLLVLVTRPKCDFCSKMKAVTFSHPAVARDIRAQYVPLMVDAAVEPELVKSWKVTRFPTTFVISPEATLTAQIVGYLPPDRFRLRLAQQGRSHFTSRRAPGRR